MTVQVNMTVEEVKYMWCQFRRARRDYIVPGLKSGNNTQVGFGVGWTDCLLDILKDKFPPECDPGLYNPSQKP